MTTVLELQAHLQTFAQTSAERLLNSVVEGVLIALFAWALLRVLGRHQSCTRFAVWFLVLLAIAAVACLGALPGDVSAVQQSPRWAIALPGWWALGMFSAWAVVASLSLAQVGSGLWQLRKLRKSCAPLDRAELDPVLRKTIDESRLSRPVALCTSALVRVPTALGFLKPVIILPAWTLKELSAAELNTVLLHELAHLRRWDDWTNLTQKILRALLFFHPAVWWVERRLVVEREMACDDAVLAQAANPHTYAECLVKLAEKSLMRRGLAMAQAAVHRMRITSLRVARILDKNRFLATRGWKPVTGLVAAFSVFCLVLLSHTPRLVIFQNPTPAIARISPPTPSVFLPKLDGSRQPTEEMQTALPGGKAGLELKRVLASSAKPPRANVRSGAAGTAVRRAKFVQREMNSTTLLPARWSGESAPTAVVVIMQGEQYDVSGLTFWRVRIYRLTVFHTPDNRIEPGNSAKSI